MAYTVKLPPAAQAAQDEYYRKQMAGTTAAGAAGTTSLSQPAPASTSWGQYTDDWIQNPTWSDLSPPASTATPAPTTNQPAYDPSKAYEQWMGLIGSQGLTQTRPGFYGTGGTSLQDMVSKFNQQYGANARIVGPDKVDFGSGAQDVVTNAMSGDPSKTEFWWDIGSAGTPAGSRSAPSPAPSAPSTGYAMPGAMFNNAPTSGLHDQLIQELLGRAQQTLAIDPATNQVIRAQADPYAARQTRSARDFVADLAERAGPTANLTGQSRLAGERAAQSSGLFESQLIGNEITARRGEIQNALTSLQGIMSTDQEAALRRELGQLDAETQRLGITTGASTAANAQDLAWRQALLSNEQFLQQLGLSAENQYNYWDVMRSGGLG